MKHNKPYDKSVYRSLVLVTQFGINMLVPILMMSAFGIFLDRRLHTTWIVIPFFFMGAAAGAQNVYRMAKRIYDNTDEDNHGKRKTHGTDNEAEK